MVLLFMIFNNFVNLFNQYFIKLRLFLILKPVTHSSICYIPDKFLLGSREKYSILSAQLLKYEIKSVCLLLDNVKYYNNQLCFISFNPLFFSLARSIALFFKQSYIVGNYIPGFFSRNMPVCLTEYCRSLGLLFFIKKSSSYILIFLTLNKSEKFITETQNLVVPVVGLVGINDSRFFFTQCIYCENLIFDYVFFYSRLLKCLFNAIFLSKSVLEKIV